jgi:antitoxin PrlF
MPVSTLTSKGQTTIPKEVRDFLRIAAGDRLDFVPQADGTVTLRAATVEVAALKGILHRQGMEAVSLAEMERAVRDRAGRRR